jgi:alpha-mannosidase
VDPRIISRKLQMLSDLAVQDRRPISHWQARTAKHIGPGEYEYLDDWGPVEDFSLWPALHTVFLSATAQVPDDWSPERTCFDFAFDAMEGLLSIGNRPWAGLDRAHARVPVPGPGEHHLQLEFISVPGAWSQPGLRGARGSFSGGQLILVDPNVEAAYYDFRFAAETARAIADERRKALLEAAIEDALIAINLTAPREQVLAEIQAGRQLLAERVAAIARDPEAGRLFLTGHTHIDTAWLWPLKETIRKCGRTFATACRLMERYPDYHFACSQAQLYRYTKQHYPLLFEEIKRWVAQGRWETTGAMWVEADANVTSGESLIRQILHGLRFFREEFGTRPTICWLPDVFGYNAGMPQILKGCGIESFWTWKLHWQSRNPFPHHLFWWEGVDGSRVLAHIPKLGGGGYNGTPSPEQLVRSWETYLQKGIYDEQLFPFGHGDGGGGVTPEMMEMANRAADYPGLPACRQGTPEQFFADVHKAAPDLPTWVGELYLETHRGTYTTQARAKRGNRRCEQALRDAEIWGTIQRCLSAEPGSAPDLSDLATFSHGAWEKVLLHQFHDILPGSSIAEVYEDTAADHAEVLREAEAIRIAAIEALCEKRPHSSRVRVFNSLSWPRSDVASATVPDPGDDAVAIGDGHALPVQVLSRAHGWADVIFGVEGVPPLGALTVEISDRSRSTNRLRAAGRTLESHLYLLELAEDGSIVRLLDKRAHREVIAPGEAGNRLQLFQDGPEREAAWNIHATYAKREYPWEGDCTVEMVERGPVRAVARVTRTHRNTRLAQDIVLYDNLPRIDFRTQVEWHEKQTMLKVAFPVAVRASHATFEVQFGAYERPNHRNTSWDQEKFEVCGLRWADLSEGGYGVSLLNDCKYGHDVLGNVLRLTLLRGTEYPDPDADQGAHEFTYSLLPHLGDWREGETVRQAAQLNVPLVAVPTAAQEPAISYVSVAGPAIVETLKPAEDGDGVILRLYEPGGGRGLVTVQHRLPFGSVVACNLAEDDQEVVPAAGGAFSFEIKPYQIRTFRLR